jgi:hypothetical protein
MTGSSLFHGVIVLTVPQSTQDLQEQDCSPVTEFRELGGHSSLIFLIAKFQILKIK